MTMPGIVIVIAAAIGLVCMSAMGDPGIRAEDDRIVIETDHVAYAVGTDGLSKTFTYKAAGRDRLDASGRVPFMAVEKDGQWIGASAVAWGDGLLDVTFGQSGIRAKVRPQAFANYLTLELVQLSDLDISRLHLVRVPLDITQTVGSALTHCRDGEHAAALFALNEHTHSYAVSLEPATPGRPIPGMPYKGARGHAPPSGGEHPVLISNADRRVGLVGAKAALFGCPTPKLDSIIEQIEIENALPHPTLGGVWARNSPDITKSTLYTECTESTVDEVINYAKAGGFSTIVLYKHVWCTTQGTPTLNTKNFPSGEAGLKAVSDKIHAAGLKFGLHNLELIVHKHDPLVRQTGGRGLLVYPDRRRTLAADIGAGDSFIATTASPRGLLASGEKSMFHGRELRIGSEIIVYGELQISEPYGFKNCSRGAMGTQAASHAAGEPIDNMAEFFWSYYIPDLQSELFDKVMQNICGILNRCNVDYYYPDGSGENTNHYPDVLPNWYTRSRSALARYKYIDREVLFAHGPVSNNSWHALVQGNHTDVAQNGSIGHVKEATLPGIAASQRNLVPFDLGWFGFFTSSENGPATRPREVAYVWAKALAYGGPVALNAPIGPLRNNGRTGEILSLIRQWEQLKLSGRVPESIRNQLKEPNREFALVRTSPEAGRTATEYGFKRKEKWHIEPVTYAPDKYIAAADGRQNVWVFNNTDATQPLRVFFNPKPALADYGDPENLVILKPGPLNRVTTGQGPMWQDRQAAGVMPLTLRPTDEDSPGGGKSLSVTAVNDGDRPMGWACAELILDATLDMTNHRALGTWVKGDGSGAVLHFTVEAGRRVVRDYYVRLDFDGWKYIAMGEPAGGEIYDFKFPFSNYWALGNMAYDVVDRVYVFVTNVAPGSRATAGFGRLEALKEAPRPLVNPGLKVNGQAITFAVTLEPDWYLEYQGEEHARAFDADGHDRGTVAPSDPTPLVRRGDNEIEFFFDREPGDANAAKITLITRGRPLR